MKEAPTHVKEGADWERQTTSTARAFGTPDQKNTNYTTDWNKILRIDGYTDDSSMYNRALA